MNKFTGFGLDHTVVVDYCGVLPIIATKNLSQIPIRVSRLTCFWIKSDLIGSNMNKFTGSRVVDIAATVVSNCLFGLDPTVLIHPVVV